MPGDGDDDRSVDEGRADGADGAPEDPRAGWPADERALLEAFERLAPQGSLRWNFDDALRRLDEPTGTPARSSPWGGLPADLWERGRSTRATERVLGDVVKIVAQDLSEYTDRAVAESSRLGEDAVDELRRTTLDALRFLSARMDRLERAADPLGIAVGELGPDAPDTAAWAGSVTGWVGTGGGPPVVVGELGDLGLVRALVGAGVGVDAVDPRGAAVWAAGAEVTASDGAVTIALDEVADHLRTLTSGSRRAVVLSGCVDRASLAAKVELVDEAVRVVGPGGTVVVLVTEQAVWDAGLGPVTADLLPGRPLHPDTWRVVLAHRGAPGAAWEAPDRGSVHAVVAEVGG